MQIKTLEVAGIAPAIHGMRNPMDSWDRSDTIPGLIGKNDKALSMKLASAGAEHAKHLRMVMVWADITAPRYWWQEFDTYRVGVEKVSCSTMHKLMARPLTINDFALDAVPAQLLAKVVEELNEQMEEYKNEHNEFARKTIWRGIIQQLPQGYLQKRTVMMSYAALRNMYRQRKGHKLNEWHEFRSWCESLPESWMITDDYTEESE